MLTRYLLPLLSAAALAFALVQMTKAQQKPPPASPPVEPARAPYAKAVAGAGLVEPESENISIGTNLPGIVAAVNVRVGDRVKAGDLLFRIDDRQLKADREVKQANLANAQAQVAKLDAQPRPEELPPVRAKSAEARANLDDQTRLFERVKRVGVGAVSEEDYVRRQIAVEVAQAQVAYATAQQRLTEAGAWEFDKKIAAAAVLQAKAQLDQTETEVSRLKVTTPVVCRPSGPKNVGDPNTAFVVLQVNVRPGEFVGATAGQPLIVLGYVGKLHVRVDVDENDIGRFREGVPGTASPRGTPARSFPISFVRVEPYVIPKKSLTGANTERVDTRVLQVIYAIDAPTPGLYVGQQLDVSLNVGGP